MTKVNSYKAQLPYALCEEVMNNETVSEIIAAKRELTRTVESRCLDGKALQPRAPVALLKPKQVYRERAGIVDTNAGRMQKMYGFEKWQQTFKMEKTGDDVALCTDSIYWPHTESAAHRTYTLSSCGERAVVMCMNPWVINLKNIPTLFESMIRSRMETEMNSADAKFPATCEGAAQKQLKKKRRAA